MFQIALLRLLTPFVTRIGSPSFRRFLLNFVPIRAVQKLKEMSDVMENTCKDILRQKRESIELNEIGDGKDIMSLLRTCQSKLPDYHANFRTNSGKISPGATLSPFAKVRANEIASEADRLSEAELLGQMK